MRCFVFLLCTIFAHKSAVSQSIYREIERIIIHDTDITYDLTPGIIIGIIDGDSTYIESFGGVVGNRRQKIVSTDLFEVGSLTKLITSRIVDVAVCNKLLSYDAEVNSFLPQEYRNPRLSDLTIEDLVDHQSGLPKRPYGFGSKEVDPQNPYAYYSNKDLLEAYTRYVPEEEEFVYSHMNYALLEIIIENIYNQPFEEVAQDLVLRPLVMKHSFLHFKEDKHTLTLGQDRSAQQVNPRTYSSFLASEGLKSNMNDLLLFLRAHLNREETVESCWQSLFSKEKSSFNDKLSTANGWQIYNINKRFKAALHTGRTSGHSAFMGMVDHTKTGVVVLSNSEYGTRDLGLLILRMINHNWKRKSN